MHIGGLPVGARRPGDALRPVLPLPLAPLVGVRRCGVGGGCVGANADILRRRFRHLCIRRICYGRVFDVNISTGPILAVRTVFAVYAVRAIFTGWSLWPLGPLDAGRFADGLRAIGQRGHGPLPNVAAVLPRRRGCAPPGRRRACLR